MYKCVPVCNSKVSGLDKRREPIFSDVAELDKRLFLRHGLRMRTSVKTRCLRLLTVLQKSEHHVASSRGTISDQVIANRVYTFDAYIGH